jgi:type I restriction enzyme S subunit
MIGPSTSYDIVSLRYMVRCLDSRRIPLNGQQRADMPGNIPYWGAGGIVGHVRDHLFDGQLVLLGEDGAPFFERGRDVAFLTEGKVWVNNHAHVLRAVDDVDARFLVYALNSVDYSAHITGSTRDKLTQEDMWSISVPRPPLEVQRLIADFLDEQVGLLEAVANSHARLLRLLDERIDAVIGACIAPALAGVSRTGMTPMKRQLRKLSRPVRAQEAQVVTAYRDGEVIARALRRAAGYTDSWTDGSSMQGVLPGDVVVHGLDGFSGAVGTSVSAGACSPANHVCEPLEGGDPDYYGRLLRILALSGYLSLYGGSSRERAVDFRNWTSFSSIPLPVVSPGAQGQVGDMVRSARPLKALVQRSRALLLERKHALVSRAVTGQVDVTTASARSVA